MDGYKKLPLTHSVVELGFILNPVWHRHVATPFLLLTQIVFLPQAFFNRHWSKTIKEPKYISAIYTARSVCTLILENNRYLFLFLNPWRWHTSDIKQTSNISELNDCLHNATSLKFKTELGNCVKIGK